MRNLFEDIPGDLPEELVEVLASGEDVRIERIVSRGHSSREGFWYDQDTREMVVLLSGSAGLMFEGRTEPVLLKPGDWLEIPPHEKHRVQWTDSDVDTVWLAIHY